MATFIVKGTWTGDRNGVGTITTDGFQTKVSAPKQLEGPGIGANPEELLIASASNCYMITLAAILSNRNIEYTHLEIESEGTVLKDGKRLFFENIVHKPIITVNDLDTETKEKLEQLAHRAEKACFISQTLKGNVEVSVIPEIKIRK
ncbi:OsmC family protein [Ferdinandcohnia quinoae]|uniref:OsmC family protein n=1 Tax=Fredinandcohnia quinoae TaxID=2918902 RepID=A0AAW5EE41_9BACI|nr:OsmC family protein [Fredinandcohnia sp. SECRCQ15]MCH1627746.1 OsmC family protein [Fredinandcohnia sp. SECRCQ15]